MTSGTTLNSTGGDLQSDDQRLNPSPLTPFGVLLFAQDKLNQSFPGGPVVGTPCLLQGAGIQFLLRCDSRTHAAQHGQNKQISK